MQDDIRRVLDDMSFDKAGQASAGTGELASRVLRVGRTALPDLVTIGEQVCRSIQEWGTVPPQQRASDTFQENARRTRALLLALAKFCDPRRFRKPLIFTEPRAIDLLCRFSDTGCGHQNEAKRLLKSIVRLVRTPSSSTKTSLTN